MRNHEPPTDEAKVARSPELARAEADVERARERVAQSVLALRNEVARRTDWREWFKRHPGRYLAAAFSFGLLWGFRRRATLPDTRIQRRRPWR